MRAREGDLVETKDGNLFDVKGLVHPPGKVIAFIRFTPDSNGERKRGDTSYRKVYPLRERYDLLREKFPQYLVFDPVFDEWLCEVPVETIEKHYEPMKFLTQLRREGSCSRLEKQTFELARLLHDSAGVRWNGLGVSGSVLVGLDTPNSDIDLLVYGSRNCWKVHEALQSLIRDRACHLRPYRRRDLRALFGFRSRETAVDFEDFVRTESRKVLQGKFQQKDYFIRCVKEWNEIGERYGSARYESFGEAEVRATVIDDSQMIFTPCVYGIDSVKTLEGKKVKPLREIVSFRGRFCEQARKGEQILARGKVERVRRLGIEQYFRLLLGNKPSDYMILAD
jgi:hypothetical protein